MTPAPTSVPGAPPGTRCPHCHTPIPTGDFSVDRTWARCRPCDARFPVEAGRDGRPPGQARPELSRPPNVDEQRGLVILSLARPWCGDGLRLLALVLVAAAAGHLLTLPAARAHLLQLAARPGPQFLALMGTVPLYLLVAGLCNETAIEADRDSVRVVHGPLPVGAHHRFPVDQVDQLYTCRIRTRVQDPLAGHRRGLLRSDVLGESIEVLYQLRLRLRSGAEHVLFDGLESPEQALYMEQELERRLGIQDRVVSGELDREWRPSTELDREQRPRTLPS